ncbi:HypC/HybG/HupF family hydrogenase formation chaperone [Helicobacter sp. MIT 14-3879]|uniref:HypC/HybG/HupF family hydrogenase formation chaperone n=1 Tax=Helicobacter sp. MIT 14-3879 TaxID=2040649 RepID=UPI000E1F5626|nr:HypC/HybG/HupF family hydrogenase formation chaperone [Helicobacter sp. MIT 14-3879]RDU64016.1 hydrogenase assembly protein HupF [Helicobacter sp. MIT 14-3879]
MCLAIPSKVISINKQTNMATLDTMGVRREASLDLMNEEVNIGEFVLLHIGYVINKIDEESAIESLKIYDEIIKEMEEEERELREANL